MSERTKIRQLLEDLDLEQKKLAREIGFHHTHMNHVLQGRRPASREFAKALAEALKKRGKSINAGALVMEELATSAA